MTNKTEKLEIMAWLYSQGFEPRQKYNQEEKKWSVATGEKYSDYFYDGTNQPWFPLEQVFELLIKNSNLSLSLRDCSINPTPETKAILYTLNILTPTQLKSEIYFRDEIGIPIDLDTDLHLDCLKLLESTVEFFQRNKS